MNRIDKETNKHTHAHVRARTRAHTHARTHARTHTLIVKVFILFYCKMITFEITNTYTTKEIHQLVLPILCKLFVQ